MTGRFTARPTVWELLLPYDRPPLSLNDQPTASLGARMGRAALVKSVRLDGYRLARSAGIPAVARFSAELNWRPARNARRDAINLVATLKPLVDGLVDAGVCADDTPAHYVGCEPKIWPAVKGKPARMWLIVTDMTNQGD